MFLILQSVRLLTSFFFASVYKKDKEPLNVPSESFFQEYTYQIFSFRNAKILTNYRPIFILRAFALIFERIWYNKMKGFFQKKLCKNQHGFGKHHSTVTNLILYCDVVYKKWKQGELPLTLFLNIAKAFDSFSHNIILYKLAKIGVDHKFLHFLHLIQQQKTNKFSS